MIDIDWVEIPEGTFLYGLTDSQIQRLSGQLPEHLSETHARGQLLRERLQEEAFGRYVVLKTFYISRVPVTNRQYLEFALSDHRFSERNVFLGEKQRRVLKSAEKSAETHGDHPVCAPWHFAMAFCEWIGARLPTSVEWEKAARGTDGRLYPWGNEWDATRGNFSRDRERWPHKTSPVDAFPSGQSPYGLLDVAGNTYEWTLSTTIDHGGRGLTELAVCRSCSCNFRSVHEQSNPVWFRNRVTSIMGNSMDFGGARFTGFRPVRDNWQIKAWAGWE